ncbi:MAG: TRAP transporter small permease subunit [Rhodoferax sp.]|nr:TRAP transporter small permease subunit [Rhodoferax sp.]
MVAATPSRFRRLAVAVSTLSLAMVFVLFIYGVGMRYLFGRPIGWVDEAVTVLSVWSVLWTAAFVLRWHEHISFDIVFINLAPRRQRAMLLVVNTVFVALMLAALPGMVDYTLFLWREKTDMLEMRLDFVYAIFPVFFIAIVLRQLASIWRLLSPRWEQELNQWTGAAALPEQT